MRKKKSETGAEKVRKRKKRANKKSIFYLLSFKNLKTEISGYGYHYSIKSFVLQLLISFAVIFIASLIYELNWVPILCLLLIGAICTPYVILAQFRYLYEEKRFADAGVYMTQMLYSFKKTPKILNALQDTQGVCSKKCSDIIQYAIDYIKKGDYKEDLYKEAFASIEKEYGCDRLSTVHRFLKHVEDVGGEYRNGVNLLLDDIQKWTERTYCYQKDRKSMKFKAMVAIVLCMVICAVIINLLPEQFSITGYPLYQISTTILLAIFIFMYSLIQSKMNGQWLRKTKSLKDKKVDYYKDLASGAKTRSLYIKVIPLIAFTIIGIGYLIFAKSYVYALICLLLLTFLIYYPIMQIRTAKRTLKREINKVFPDWIRDLSLNLQMQNVYVAIRDTTPNTPYVLRTELEYLLEQIDKDPVSIKPYYDFLSEFDIPEIATNMSMIYSLNKYGRADAEKQINTLIERNSKLLEKSEILKNKDEIGVTGFFLMTVPELCTVVKLLIDMTLMLMTFLSMTQSMV